MDKLHPKAMKIYEEIRNQILENRFGRPGEPFIAVRELSNLFSMRTDTALGIFEVLREEGLIMLARKKHYLSHGLILPGTPLRRNRTERKLIALLATNIESYYFPAFADKIESLAQKAGYDIMVQHIKKENVSQRIQSVYEMGAQGVIAMAFSDVCLALCQKKILPTVLMGRDFTDFGVDCVLSGGKNETVGLVELMLEVGCEKFYFVCPGRDDAEKNAIFRHLRDALGKKNIIITTDDVISNSDFDCNSRRIGKMLSKTTGKIGIVCSNEPLCREVTRCCYENSIPFPEKAVISVFRTKTAFNQDYQGIISVEENLDKEAETAFTLLKTRMEGDMSPAKRVVVEPIMMNRMF